MKIEDYNRIYYRLRTPKDIDILAKEARLDRELLLVLYSQRTVRDATRRYYIVKKDAKRLVKAWRSGKSFLRLAQELNFPPILLAMLLCLEMRMPRKQFWKNVREPKQIRDARLRREFAEIAEGDLIYSPKGAQIQAERGEWGERKLQEWLERHHIEYRTEDDLRGLYPKTPDCLLAKPLTINGTKVHWIESKASFGDEVELRKNLRRQLKPYTELFGQGAVVYWFGFLEGIEQPEGVLVVDGNWFEHARIGP